MASPLYNSRQLLLVVGILAAAGFGVALSIMQGPTSLRALLPPVQTSRPAGIIMSSADFTTVLTGTSTTIYIAGVDRDRPSSQRRINGVLQTEDIVADTALPSGATLTRCNYTGSSGTTPITVSVYCLQWTPSVTHLGSYPLVFRTREYGTGTWSDTPSTLTLTVSNGSSSSSSNSSLASSAASSSSLSNISSIQLFYMNDQKICVKTGLYGREERCVQLVNSPFYSENNILNTPSPKKFVIDDTTGIAYVVASRYSDKAILIYKINLANGQSQEICRSTDNNPSFSLGDRDTVTTLALDTDEQKLFWIEYETDLRWCFTDGSGSGFILDQVVSGTTESHGLIDIALHRSAKRVYWLQQPSSPGVREGARSINYNGTGLRTETMPTFSGPTGGNSHFRNIGIREENSQVFAAYATSASPPGVGWSGIPFAYDNHHGVIRSHVYDESHGDLYWLADDVSDKVLKTNSGGSTSYLLQIDGRETYPVMTLCLETASTPFCNPFFVGSAVSSSSTSPSSSSSTSSVSSSSSSSSASTTSSSSASSTSSSTIDLSKGIYFTKPDGIYRANADGTMVQKLFTTAQEVNGLGVNAQQNRIYYSVDTNIYSSNIQGGDVQILLNRSSAPNAYPVEKIFLDEQRDYLYWQDHSGFYRINIGSTPANGESIKSCDVIQYLGSRCEYALDVTRQLVYTLSVLRYTGVNTLSLTSYDMQTHIESSSLIDQRFTPSNELGIAGIAMESWPDYGIQFGVQRNTLDGYGNVLNTSTEFFAIFPDFSLTSLNSFGLFPSDTSKLSMKAQWLAIGEDGRAIYKNGNNWGSAPFLNGANNIVLKEVINVPFVNSCGNSIVEGDEECDFGPNNELYGCFANCSTMLPPDELP